MSLTSPTRNDYAEFITKNWDAVVDAAEERWKVLIDELRANGKEEAAARFMAGESYGLFDPFSIRVQEEIRQEGLDIINYSAVAIKRSSEPPPPVDFVA